MACALKDGIKPMSSNWPRLMIIPVICGLYRMDGIVQTPFPANILRLPLWIAIIDIQSEARFSFKCGLSGFIEENEWKYPLTLLVAPEAKTAPHPPQEDLGP